MAGGACRVKKAFGPALPGWAHRLGGVADRANKSPRTARAGGVYRSSGIAFKRALPQLDAASLSKSFSIVRDHPQTNAFVACRCLVTHPDPAEEAAAQILLRRCRPPAGPGLPTGSEAPSPRGIAV
jgi:hypothetical protein